MATTITTKQMGALLKVEGTLREAFKDMTPAEVAEVVSLFAGREDEREVTLRAGTKSEQLIKMLSRKKGATLDEVIETFGIKKNSAYARISVESRKRGLTVEHVDGHYHIAN